MSDWGQAIIPAAFLHGSILAEVAELPITRTLVIGPSKQ